MIQICFSPKLISNDGSLDSLDVLRTQAKLTVKAPDAQHTPFGSMGIGQVILETGLPLLPAILTALVAIITELKRPATSVLKFECGDKKLELTVKQMTDMATTLKQVEKLCQGHEKPGQDKPTSKVKAHD
jgi:hypothetical protein